MVGSLCAACASSGGVQNVHTAKPEPQEPARVGRESTRYASRVMSLADTRGVSVMWFNAPIEPVEAATRAAAPVACATATKN